MWLIRIKNSECTHNIMYFALHLKVTLTVNPPIEYYIIFGNMKVEVYKPVMDLMLVVSHFPSVLSNDT
jgi:hypothetical protein